MSKKCKKTISLFLILAMLLSVVPAGAFAAEEPTDPQSKPLPPVDLITTAVTAEGAEDGTIYGFTPDMEYSTDSTFTNPVDVVGESLENLKPGDYYVRYKANGDMPCSDAVKYIIADYGKTAYYLISDHPENFFFQSAIVDKGTAITLPDLDVTQENLAMIGWVEGSKDYLSALHRAGDQVKIDADTRIYARIDRTVQIPELTEDERDTARLYALGDYMEGYIRNPSLWRRQTSYFEPLMPEGPAPTYEELSSEAKVNCGRTIHKYLISYSRNPSLYDDLGLILSQNNLAVQNEEGLQGYTLIRQDIQSREGRLARAHALGGLVMSIARNPSLKLNLETRFVEAYGATVPSDNLSVEETAAYINSVGDLLVGVIRNPSLVNMLFEIFDKYSPISLNTLATMNKEDSLLEEAQMRSVAYVQVAFARNPSLFNKDSTLREQMDILEAILMPKPNIPMESRPENVQGAAVAAVAGHLVAYSRNPSLGAPNSDSAMLLKMLEPLNIYNMQGIEPDAKGSFVKANTAITEVQLNRFSLLKALLLSYARNPSLAQRFSTIVNESAVPDSSQIPSIPCDDKDQPAEQPEQTSALSEMKIAYAESIGYLVLAYSRNPSLMEQFENIYRVYGQSFLLDEKASSKPSHPSTPVVPEPPKTEGTATTPDSTLNAKTEGLSGSVVREVEAMIPEVNVINGTDAAVKVTVTKDNQPVNQFTQPLTVTVPLTKQAAEKVKDPSKLTMARVTKDEKGNVKLEYMGGKYDPSTETFTAKVDEAGDYVLVENDAIKKITLTIGNKNTVLNDKAYPIDVPPMIIGNRTMVPLRYIGQSLGCIVNWNDKIRSITVSQGTKKLEMTVDVEIPGYGQAPVIRDNRTLVPIRYISESLDANVIYDPTDREVIIVK